METACVPDHSVEARLPRILEFYMGRGGRSAGQLPGGLPRHQACTQQNMLSGSSDFTFMRTTNGESGIGGPILVTIFMLNVMPGSLSGISLHPKRSLIVSCVASSCHSCSVPLFTALELFICIYFALQDQDQTNKEFPRLHQSNSQIFRSINSIKSFC